MKSQFRIKLPQVKSILPVPCLALCLIPALLPSKAQTPNTSFPQEATSPTPNPDAQVVTDGPPASTPAALKDQAWKMLADAAADKHSETRVQALAALGTLPEPRAYALIETALSDTDIDTRTAAVLACGQSHDLRLIGKLHAMLDDKEPQVAFAAATVLWKMKDYSGEDILVAVAAGDRKANATFVNGTLHTANKDFHNPSTIARLGVEQGASILLGPFGFGITAYEAMRRNGGSSARVTAIDQLAESHTGPIRAELLSATTDKDPGVRAAAAKALGAYAEPDVPPALVKLFDDSKLPVRYTAAASYLRVTSKPSAAKPSKANSPAKSATPKKSKTP